MITNQLWIFGLRLLPTTPSLCTLFAQSSFALHPTSSLFLSPTFEVQTIPLLMLCPIFRCSGSVNSPRRQIWNPLPCLPQYRPSGRSPSLSPVSIHCPFNSPHLLCWNSPVCFLLSFKAMDPFPASELQLRYFASRLCNQVSFPTIKLYLAGIRFAHLENSLADPFARCSPPSFTPTTHQADHWALLSPPPTYHHVSHAPAKRSFGRRPPDHIAGQTHALVSLYSGLLWLPTFEQVHLTIFN